MKTQAFSSAHAAIAALRAQLTADVKDIPKARREWVGANVIVSAIPQGGCRRNVVTPHALEASWIFADLPRCVRPVWWTPVSKFELYGRLELAANAVIKRQPDVDVATLCSALLDEGEAILTDMQRGCFSYLPIALGAEIAHDYDGGRIMTIRWWKRTMSPSQISLWA